MTDVGHRAVKEIRLLRAQRAIASYLSISGPWAMTEPFERNKVHQIDVDHRVVKKI